MIEIEDVAKHNHEVGFLCAQWSYLEWILELANWWFLGLLNKPKEGRTITGGLSIEVLARRARDLAPLQIKDPTQLATFKSIADRINAIIDERNIAIHGVRSLQPDDTVLAQVGRGPYKGTPQKISLIRLTSLNAEVSRILSVTEPLLNDLGVIEGVSETARLYKHPQQA